MLPVLIRPDTKTHDLSSPRRGLVQPAGRAEPRRPVQFRSERWI